LVASFGVAGGLFCCSIPGPPKPDVSPDDGSRETSMGILVRRIAVSLKIGAIVAPGSFVPQGGSMVSPTARWTSAANAGLTIASVGSSRLDDALFVGYVSRCRASS
jgi:hypothetical protein